MHVHVVITKKAIPLHNRIREVKHLSQVFVSCTDFCRSCKYIKTTIRQNRNYVNINIQFCIEDLLKKYTLVYIYQLKGCLERHLFHLNKIFTKEIGITYFFLTRCYIMTEVHIFHFRLNSYFVKNTPSLP
ncbi:hypothetical protein EGW08_005269 [Elysia chlorotica]|uniref:Uncharacterized protein n=1 Tax=Elysia chlorotica TaxID=188477 RepID=A0A433TZD8_ELYCH|nr:hypothetical protein EGW08_005269 [Elysia chlorotica]